MSERLYKTLERVNGTEVRIARFHNIFGPYSEYNSGREKAPAALCRKVAMADSEIEIFGDGEQARSFLYIEDCMDAVEDLMMSDFSDPINIGSSRTITINDLADMIINFSRKNIDVKHIDGPIGVPARTSDNTLFDEVIGQKHNYSLEEGIELLYTWVRGKCNGKQSSLDNYCFFDILITMKGEGNGRCNRSRLWWQHRNGV